MSNTDIELPIINMSFSKIECYHDCPRKFFYKYVKSIQEQMNMIPDNPLICGSAVDRGFEEAWKTNDVQKGFKIAEEYYTEYFSGVDEQAELELMKILCAINKLYDYFQTVGISNINLQVQCGQVFEIESDDGEKKFKVSWIGWIDALTKNSIFDMKYTSNPSAYRDSDQIHLYAYLLNPEMSEDKLIKQGGYICAKKSKLKRRKATKNIPEETIVEYAKRLEDGIQVEFINVKPSLQIGEAFVDKAHDIIMQIYDKEGNPCNDVNQYAKTGQWCKNCYYLDLCGGKQ